MVLCIRGRGLGGMEGNSGSQLGGEQLLTKQGGPKKLVGGIEGKKDKIFLIFLFYGIRKVGKFFP